MIDKNECIFDFQVSESPEIEKEVKRLLRTDLSAATVSILDYMYYNEPSQ
jgi:hypothetical protein